MPMSLRCICTVDQRRLAEATSCVNSVQSHSNRIRAPRWGLVPDRLPRGRALLHNLAGHSVESIATRVWRFPGRPRPNPQSTARVSPTAPMQNHLAKKRAMSPGSLSADSPQRDNGGHTRGKRHRAEEQRAGGATGALQPASPGSDLTSTDWGSASLLPRHYARHPVRREQRRVWGRRAGEVAALVCYVQELRGTHPFRDLVHRAGRLQDKGPEMAEGRWRRMLGEALRGVDVDGPRERGRNPRVQMLRELLQTVGWYCRGQGTRQWRGVGQRGGDPYRREDVELGPQGVKGGRDGRRRSGLRGTSARLGGCVGSGHRHRRAMLEDGRRGCGRHGASTGTRKTGRSRGSRP